MLTGKFTPSAGQGKKPIIYSASSDWQKVTFRPTAQLKPEQSLAKAPSTVRPPATRPATEPVQQPASQPSAPVESVKTNNAVAANEPANRSSPPATQSTAPVVTASQPSRTNPGMTMSSGFRPAFTGDFATNRNGWKAGAQGDYHYQIGLGRYNIRKRKANTQQVAFSFVPLPSDLNLNLAEEFTIKIDVMADSGRIPTGGLLFGVADSLNFCAFTLNGKGEVSVIRVTNGQASDMPGDFYAPGVPVDKNRNRLTVRRQRDALHFYINEQEVRSSPYPFKLFSGNGVGMITSGYWTSFQKLSVVLGP